MIQNSPPERVGANKPEEKVGTLNSVLGLGVGNWCTRRMTGKLQYRLWSAVRSHLLPGVKGLIAAVTDKSKMVSNVKIRGTGFQQTP